MKHYFYIFILSFLLNTQIHADASVSPIHYNTTRNDYTFSTTFEMANQLGSQGIVVKNIYHLTAHYDVYDRYGLFEAQGICRFFGNGGLGLVFKWAAIIDVHDDQGNYVGYFDGQVLTTEHAKFNFYNSERELIAVAYLDHNSLGFSLVDPKKPHEILARLSRHFIEGTVDYWDVTIYDAERLSPILIKVFAAFACDTQNSFKKDN